MNQILGEKGGARISSRLENFSIMLHSRAPNQISNLSGSKWKVSSLYGAVHLDKIIDQHGPVGSDKNARKWRQYLRRSNEAAWDHHVEHLWHV